LRGISSCEQSCEVVKIRGEDVELIECSVKAVTLWKRWYLQKVYWVGIRFVKYDINEVLRFVMLFQESEILATS